MAIQLVRYCLWQIANYCTVRSLTYTHTHTSTGNRKHTLSCCPNRSTSHYSQMFAASVNMYANNFINYHTDTVQCSNVQSRRLQVSLLAYTITVKRKKNQGFIVTAFFFLLLHPWFAPASLWPFVSHQELSSQIAPQMNGAYISLKGFGMQSSGLIRPPSSRCPLSYH